MDTERSGTGAVAVARIPGAVEVYLITRMAVWDGAVLPVVLGHARTREAALEFARKEVSDGFVWIDGKPAVDGDVLLPPGGAGVAASVTPSQSVRRVSQ